MQKSTTFHSKIELNQFPRKRNSGKKQSKMKSRTFCLLLIVLICGICSAALMQSPQSHHQSRRKIQSETRIKLPSDIAFTHESTGDIEGEACHHLLHQIDGICMLPNQCPEAIRDFQKGIQPQLCNYKGHLPIICCPRSQKTTVASSPPPPSTQSHTSPTLVTTYIGSPISTTTPTSSSVPSPQPDVSSHRISERKCKEYTKLMIEETVVRHIKRLFLAFLPLVSNVPQFIYSFSPKTKIKSFR